VLWDGGARTAEVDRSEAVVKELLLQFGRVTATALREVEDAAVQERQTRALLVEIDNQMKVAQATLEQTRERYVRGLTDYLPVLTALSTLQQVEQSRLGARLQLVSARIQVYRALGGRWLDNVGTAPERAASATTPPSESSGESGKSE
jgi:outer membrane protein TolC